MSNHVQVRGLTWRTGNHTLLLGLGQVLMKPGTSSDQSLDNWKYPVGPFSLTASDRSICVQITTHYLAAKILHMPAGQKCSS